MYLCLLPVLLNKVVYKASELCVFVGVWHSWEGVWNLVNHVWLWDDQPWDSW